MGCKLCIPCRYEKNDETPRNRRFSRNGQRVRQGNEIVKERHAIPEGTYNVKLRGEKHCIINSAAYLPTGDIVMSDMINMKIKLFTCNFQIVTFIEFPMSVQYLCASVNLPLVYAAFPDRIRQLHVDGISLKRSGFIKTPGYCRGVCLNKFEGKAITLSMDDDVGQVNLLTPGGNLQLEINADAKGEQVFIRPESITVTRDLNIVVADKGTNSVIGLHPDGEVMFIYKGIRVPSALVCDEQNYIYVAGPNSIHQLNDKEYYVARRKCYTRTDYLAVIQSLRDIKDPFLGCQKTADDFGRNVNYCFCDTNLCNMAGRSVFSYMTLSLTVVFTLLVMNLKISL